VPEDGKQVIRFWGVLHLHLNLDVGIIFTLFNIAKYGMLSNSFEQSLGGATY